MGLANNIMDMLVKKARIERTPITVNFELLPVCNLNCKMCYIRSSWSEVQRFGGLKTVDEWLELAKELKEAGTLFILLTGGEVFIYPEFKRLYIELYKMGFVLTVNTNGTLVDEETVLWLKKYPPKCMSISLYGASDETYEKLCGQKQMFSKVTSALELLQKNHISVECKTILTPINVEDLQACCDYVRKQHIPYEVVTYSFPATRKNCKEEQIRFCADEAADIMFYRSKIMSDENEYAQEIHKYMREYEQTKDIPGAIQKGFTCSACNSSCWITWQGRMTPCALMPEPYTFPFEDGFLPAWEALKAKTDEIVLSSKCSHCDKRQVCTVCPAAAYAETGRFDGTSEYHCRMTERILETMNQFVKDNGSGEE